MAEDLGKVLYFDATVGDFVQRTPTNEVSYNTELPSTLDENIFKSPDTQLFNAYKFGKIFIPQWHSFFRHQQAQE